MRRRSLTLVTALALLGVAARAHAAPILLTSTSEAQLEDWLGQGDLTFTNVFEKQAGSTFADFEAAVDGQGATFTLMEVLVGDVWHVIGGYNPQSWLLTGDYTYTPLDADRTAFIYNLTTGVKQDQRLTTDPFIADDWGLYQTGAGNGPHFGQTDILFGKSTLGDFGVVTLEQYSYGSGAPCGHAGQDIVGITTWENCSGKRPAGKAVSVGAVETYMFSASPTSVPEPGSLSLLVLGMAAVAAGRRRFTPSVQR